MNEKLFAQARTLKVNDVIRVTDLTKHIHTGQVYKDRVLDTFTCRVSSLEVKDDCVSITYVPCQQPNSVQCGFGCTFVRVNNDRAHKEGVWGWQNIEVIGTEKPWSVSRWYPRPGNKGYDLMC